MQKGRARPKKGRATSGKAFASEGDNAEPRIEAAGGAADRDTQACVACAGRRQVSVSSAMPDGSSTERARDALEIDGAPLVQPGAPGARRCHLHETHGSNLD